MLNGLRVTNAGRLMFLSESPSTHHIRLHCCIKQQIK